jgi:hypothetical protein
MAHDPYEQPTQTIHVYVDIPPRLDNRLIDEQCALAEARLRFRLLQYHQQQIRDRVRSRIAAARSARSQAAAV